MVQAVTAAHPATGIRMYSNAPLDAKQTIVALREIAEDIDFCINTAAAQQRLSSITHMVNIIAFKATTLLAHAHSHSPGADADADVVPLTYSPELLLLVNNCVCINMAEIGRNRFFFKHLLNDKLKSINSLEDV